MRKFMYLKETKTIKAAQKTLITNKINCGTLVSIIVKADSPAKKDAIIMRKRLYCWEQT